MPRAFLATVIIIGLVAIGWFVLQRGGVAPDARGIGTNTLPTNPTFSYSNATSDMIFITSPQPGSDSTDTIVVKGFARGNWYFEAVFPVVVENDQGMILGQGQGQAESDWMSPGFVPFTAEADLKTPYTGLATVILKKDNPSGDPSKDASISFPILIE